MPDIDKVIEILEKAKTVIETWVPVFEQGNSHAGIDFAIDLLKEREPVKPVQHLVYTTKGWFCGACDGRLNRLGKYCSFCGREVKWE